jgi:Domain of unknown function (DUF4157)
MDAAGVKVQLRMAAGIRGIHAIATGGRFQWSRTQGGSRAAQGGEAMSGGVGMPGQMAQGIEQLSGVPMDAVKVHYNSLLPVQQGVRSFTQGNDIHLAPGAEKHLPHEVWHVVQQAQGGPVKPVVPAIGVMDDRFLEGEADRMGARALQLGPKP